MSFHFGGDSDLQGCCEFHLVAVRPTDQEDLRVSFFVGLGAMTALAQHAAETMRQRIDPHVVGIPYWMAHSVTAFASIRAWALDCEACLSTELPTLRSFAEDGFELSHQIAGAQSLGQAPFLKPESKE